MTYNISLGQVVSTSKNRLNVRTFVRNAGRGQLSSERRHNENDVVMIIAGLRRYGDWRHVATNCNALVRFVLGRTEIMGTS